MKSESGQRRRAKYLWSEWMIPWSRWIVAGTVGLVLAVGIAGCRPVSQDGSAQHTAPQEAALLDDLSIENVWSQPAVVLDQSPGTQPPCPEENDDDVAEDSAESSAESSAEENDAHSAMTHSMTDMQPCDEMDHDGHDVAMVESGGRGVVYMTILHRGGQPDRLVAMTPMWLWPPSCTRRP
ncbi:MAG: hypothetical protein HC802_13625 [Caldilineaceae bacterium]|nr:hypothetical protein [Caldilineaceae bacterium]